MSDRKLNNIANKHDRETKEMRNLFQDPKFARYAFRAIGGAIAQRPAAVPVHRFDKDGNETFESLVENYTYQSLCEDLKRLGGPQTEPTELEMILSCQAQMARVNASNFVAFRDSIGAKPVDESKIDNTPVNEYSMLTDEELELIALYREGRNLLVEPAKSDDNNDDTAGE